MTVLLWKFSLLDAIRPLFGYQDTVLVLGALIVIIFLIVRLVRKSEAKPSKDENWVILDGSNVLYWKDETPQIKTVREVLTRLKELGFTPGVMFDANAGYLVSGSYQHDHRFSQQLGLPESHVMVVPKGTPADPYILAAARDLGARIVTNDRYRDWEKKHSEIRTPGFLIKGGYRSGKLWLDVD
ncbi:hypothetical protein [Phaeobacter sp. NW0010-22]|uniref:NYN domain-containing protein n=1 Tax=Phaeobacter sp. NW0010-22 TaxID=3135907 RepID=UPI0031098453